MGLIKVEQEEARVLQRPRSAEFKKWNKTPALKLKLISKLCLIFVASAVLNWRKEQDSSIDGDHSAIWQK